VPKKIAKQTRRLESGQSMVEMSIGFVILLLLLSGLLDLGRIYFTYVALEDAVGEAALYLSINPDCRTEADGAECQNPNNAEFRAVNANKDGMSVDWTKVTVLIDRPSVYGVGDPVSVTIQYPFQLITPLIPRFVGINPITLTTQAGQIIIGE
jgi:Flp pilus assembly protein TadG